MSAPSVRELVLSLNSHTCPGCAGRKRQSSSLCGSCYHRLPRGQQLALYRRIGDGYEKAMSDALATLGAANFAMPAKSIPTTSPPTTEPAQP